MATPAPRPFGRGRRLAAVVLLAAVLSPLVVNRDGFPFSSLPMYAWDRPRVERFATVVGLDGAGIAHRLSTTTIALTDDPLIAETTVERAISAGRSAGSARTSPVGWPAAIVRVEVVEEERDVVEAAAGRPSLEARTVLATCAVPA